MAIELEDFLESVVSQAAETLQLRDPASDTVAEDDSLVKICSEIAYSQSVAFLNRALIKATFKELYLEEEIKFTLKNTPVVSVTNIWNNEGTLLTVDVDYTVKGNVINLDPEEVGYFSLATEQENRDRHTVIVEYVGGYPLGETDPNIGSALTIQTVVNYNRKDHLGLFQVTGGTTSSRHGGQIKVTDTETGGSGKLFGAVQQMFAPYIYYGDAAPIET